ncbi:nitroreductase family protein [Azomonas macrocytogenes]|uniref:Putative NAD(P)H nitroreductase n=1 Tax=Azomonas macrocytogenes TaxID=69962 RepID=A0A839T4B6_AZOMA|nr:nitroreductase family protein [Azomonas macrocytogenes]MBB3103174.1 nitroreductase [Azomonas macrocytogenes]
MAELNAAEPGSIRDNPVLAFLLGRHSCHKVRAPGPNEAELQLILQAALRAPDFLRLRPFRFLIAQDEGLDRLGQAMQRAAIAAGKDATIIDRAPRMPHRAPLLITVVASLKPNNTVPPFDQELCAGSTVLMMQMAARALGYGGVWRSGWLMYDEVLHRELALGEHERIVGFLYLGTPAHAESGRLPVENPHDYVTWV